MIGLDEYAAKTQKRENGSFAFGDRGVRLADLLAAQDLQPLDRSQENGDHGRTNDSRVGDRPND
jgi:hypothetical protein